MTKQDRNIKMYFDDIILSLERIIEYTHNLTFQDFVTDYKTIDAVIRNFEIIGEATKNIPQEVKAKYAEIPWDEMYLLRNKLSHDYFGVDYEIIWDIITNYIPENLRMLMKASKDFDN